MPHTNTSPSGDISEQAAHLTTCWETLVNAEARILDLNSQIPNSAASQATQSFSTQTSGVYGAATLLRQQLKAVGGEQAYVSGMQQHCETLYRACHGMLKAMEGTAPQTGPVRAQIAAELKKLESSYRPLLHADRQAHRQGSGHGQTI